MSNVQLVKSESFGNVGCDFWQNEQSDILMTREQIGIALGYTDPMVAIGKIHIRHDDRLNKYSFTTLVNGRETYFYTSKGIMEICRWSQQPKADVFMDWVWDVIETIRKTGTYTYENDSVKQYLNMSEEDRAILYFQQLKEKKELEQQKQLMAPKADMFDTFISASNNQTISEVAKILGTGRNRLFIILREKKILMSSNVPYQRYIDEGYFVVKEKPISMGNDVINKPQTYATAKGINYIAKILKEEKAVVC